MSTPSRVLVAVDLSAASRGALEYARTLRARWAAVIDVFYVWTVQLDGPRPDAVVVRELEAFSRSTAWDVFDFLCALERAGELNVRGYMTPDATGQTLSAIGWSDGYDLVVVGSARAEIAEATFSLHGARRAVAHPHGICPVLTVVGPNPPATATARVG